MPVDQTLRCRECGVDFIWTAGEQEFFASRNLMNPPARCPSCRAAARANRDGGGYSGSGGGGYQRSDRQRTYTEVICAACGAKARVPFEPRGDRPVYCSDCFRSGVR